MYVFICMCVHLCAHMCVHVRMSVCVYSRVTYTFLRIQNVTGLVKKAICTQTEIHFIPPTYSYIH